MEESSTLENKKPFNDREFLIGILVLFVITIIALIFAIIAVNNRPSNDGVSSDDDARRAFDESFTEQVRDLKETTSQIIEKDPVDVDRINELYNAMIANALKNNEPNYMLSLVFLRNDLFLSKNMKREALDALIAGDYSMLLDPDLYRVYTKIIELAEELDDKEVLDKYNKLRDGVTGDYWMEYHGTAAGQELIEKEASRGEPLEDLPDEEEEE